MNVIILCAGKGLRWENFRGTPKHLLKIEDEVLLERTYRQFSKYTNKIIIVSENLDYKIGNACLYLPLKGEDCWNDLTKLWSSHHLWSEDRTVLVFGDVYFTDYAVDSIMNSSGSINFFLRPSASLFTGKKYKEIFAIAFNSSLNKDILKFIERALTLNDVEQCRGGWILFNEMQNVYLQSVQIIDDWTEDFDCQQDLENWEKQRQVLGPQGYIYCSKEGEQHKFDNYTDVAYGIEGNFNYLYNQIGIVTFNNKTFGDPVPHRIKMGFFRKISNRKG